MPFAGCLLTLALIIIGGVIGARIGAGAGAVGAVAGLFVGAVVMGLLLWGRARMRDRRGQG